jgi:hypothetical protein
MRPSGVSVAIAVFLGSMLPPSLTAAFAAPISAAEVTRTGPGNVISGDLTSFGTTVFQCVTSFQPCGLTETATYATAGDLSISVSGVANSSASASGTEQAQFSFELVGPVGELVPLDITASATTSAGTDSDVHAQINIGSIFAMQACSADPVFSLNHCGSTTPASFSGTYSVGQFFAGGIFNVQETISMDDFGISSGSIDPMIRC